MKWSVITDTDTGTERERDRERERGERGREGPWTSDAHGARPEIWIDCNGFFLGGLSWSLSRQQSLADSRAHNTGRCSRLGGWTSPLLA